MPTHSRPRVAAWVVRAASSGCGHFFLHKEREGEEGRAFREKKHFFPS